MNETTNESINRNVNESVPTTPISSAEQGDSVMDSSSLLPSGGGNNSISDSVTITDNGNVPIPPTTEVQSEVQSTVEESTTEVEAETTTEVDATPTVSGNELQKEYFDTLQTTLASTTENDASIVANLELLNGSITTLNDNLLICISLLTTILFFSLFKWTGIMIRKIVKRGGEE